MAKQPQPKIEIQALSGSATERAAQVAKRRAASAAEYELSEARRRSEQRADYARDQRTQDAITAEEHAVSERLDAAIAVDMGAELKPLIEEWRREPTRTTETAMVEAFYRFAPRAETEVGASLDISRLLLTAYYRSEVARRAGAVTALGTLEALGYGAVTCPGNAAAHAAQHITSGNVPALRAALTELEQSVVARANRAVTHDALHTETCRKRLDLYSRFATQLNHGRAAETFERAAVEERKAAELAASEAHRLRIVRHRGGEEVGLTPDEATAAESHSGSFPFGPLVHGVRRAATALLDRTKNGASDLTAREREDTERGLRALEAAGAIAPSSQ